VTLETDMKPYTPDTPRAAFAVAALAIAVATLVALVGMPTLAEVPDTALSMARARGAIVVERARSDLRAAGEMYARANALAPDEVR
jgi:hypothetical protein